MGKPTRRKKRKGRFDPLKGVEKLLIVLDNGDPVTFDLSEVFAIPTDPLKREFALSRVQADLAFWKYQAAVARTDMLEAERAAEEAYSRADLIHRQDLSEGSGHYTERVVKSLVELSDYADVRADVLTKRKEHLQTVKTYEILRAVATAMEHKSNNLRALVRHSGNE